MMHHEISMVSVNLTGIVCDCAPCLHHKDYMMHHGVSMVSVNLTEIVCDCASWLHHRGYMVHHEISMVSVNPIRVVRGSASYLYHRDHMASYWYHRGGFIKTWRIMKSLWYQYDDYTSSCNRHVISMICGNLITRQAWRTTKTTNRSIINKSPSCGLAIVGAIDRSLPLTEEVVVRREEGAVITQIQISMRCTYC